MINHLYKPCHYPLWIALALGVCLNPDGPDRCHVKNCGKKREDHPLVLNKKE